MRDTEGIKADQQDRSTEWDWVMTKWPTSHTTKPKKSSKAAAAPRPAHRTSQGCRHKQMVEIEMIQNILMDRWSRTSWWIVRKKLHEERILRRSSYGWTQPRRDQNGVGKSASPIPARDRWKLFRSDWWVLVLATLFFLLSSWFTWPLFFCTESEESIDFRIQRIYSSNSRCFDSSLSCFVSDVTTHCHQQCASAYCANSASPILVRDVMTFPLMLVRPGHWQLLDGLFWVSLSLSLSGPTTTAPKFSKRAFISSSSWRPPWGGCVVPAAIGSNECLLITLYRLDRADATNSVSHEDVRLHTQHERQPFFHARAASFENESAEHVKSAGGDAINHRQWDVSEWPMNMLATTGARSPQRKKTIRGHQEGTHHQKVDSVILHVCICEAID